MDILPGQDWDYEIEQALKTSDFVLVFLSTRSVEKVGYVQREFRRALYHAEELPESFIHTIPVKLDECSVPRQFQRHQWVNLYENGAFNRIVSALHYGLKQRVQPLPEPFKQKDPPSTRPATAPLPILPPLPKPSLSEGPTMQDTTVETYGQATLANENIVPRIDDTARIWEISRDFVAGMLQQIRFIRWLAPAALVLWLIIVLAVIPLYREWKHRGAFQEFNEMAIGQVTLSNEPESPRYTVTIKQPVSDALLSSVINLLSQLKYPIYSLNLSSAVGLTDLTPLARLSTLQELRLISTQELTDLTPLTRLQNLQVLKLVGAAKLTDLTPLARLHKLSRLEPRDAKQLTDLAGPFSFRFQYRLEPMPVPVAQLAGGMRRQGW